MSASAYSLTAMIPSRAFRVIIGELERGGIKGPELEHFFCADCKTWVFTRIIGKDEFVNVRPSIFDDPRLSLPFIETMTAEKLSWAETPARYSYESYPSVEEFRRLVEEFTTHQCGETLKVAPIRQ